MHGSENRFEGRQGLAYALVLLLFLLLWLAADFTYSHLFRASTEYEQLAGAPAVGYTAKPNARFLWRDRHGEYAVAVRHDTYGFRADPDREGTRECEAGVAVIGASVAAAQEVPYPDAFPTRLEALLSGPCVINAGVRSYDTHQEILNYRYRIRPHKPQLLLYLLSSVHMKDNVHLENRASFIQLFGRGYLGDGGEERWMPPARGRERTVMNAKIWFARNLSLTRKAVQGLAGLFLSSPARPAETPDPESPGPDPEAVRESLRLLEILDREAARDGTRLVLAWFPRFYDPETAQGVMEQKGILKPSARERFLAGSREDRAYYLAVRAWAREKGVPFLDTPECAAEKGEPGRSPVFRGDNHYNVYGNRLLARCAAEGLEPYLPKP